MRVVYPVKIVEAKGEITNAEMLLKNKTLQIGLVEPELAVIKGKGHIILDFGKELTGGARILCYVAEGNKTVRLRFGESVGETMAELGEKNATNDHSDRDMKVELQRLSDMTFAQTGFRFLRIDFGENADIGLKCVVAATDIDEREAQGSFECNDELLNTVWATAAYTLRLCLKNGYVWDGVKRDRLVWIGDIYPETKTAFCLFKDVPEIKNSLIFCRDQTPEGAWMNNIPNYSFWWLLNLCEYVNRSDDEKFAKDNAEFINRIIGDAEKHVKADGTTDFPFDFIDWPSHYDGDGDEDKRYDEIAGTNYLLRIIFSKTAKLLRRIGENAEVAENIVAKLEKKKYEIRKYKQIAALGVLAGEKNEHMLEVMERGGSEGLTTFLNYFIFTALGEYGKYDEAAAMIREYYGKMLSLGATTFWEDFDVAWAENANRIDEIPVAGKKDVHGDYGKFCYKGYRHSLCHGWASGILAYMSENILGIRPVEGDSRKFTFEPHLSDLKYVKGVYPTPYGNITVKVEVTASGELIKTVEAPADIEII